jgi:hypothetical protein
VKERHLVRTLPETAFVYYYIGRKRRETQMNWADPKTIWPETDWDKVDWQEVARTLEHARKDMQAHLNETRKFMEETPAVLRSDAPLDVKRRRRQQCLKYLYGHDDADNPPRGEVVRISAVPAKEKQ